MLKKLINRVARGQKGFTLIEMIVVVGIIAVLAAVIVPNIGRFIGSGEAGAKDAEWEAVQTAMNAMMADNAITNVDIHTGALATSIGGSAAVDWTSFPVVTGYTPPVGSGKAVELGNYLQDAVTVYFYCYDADGEITFQHETASACIP